MNIMESLGFSKRGAKQQRTDNNSTATPEPGMFNDRHARGKDESRIWNLIILDESGSMSGIRRQALDGVNQTIATIRDAQQENPDDHQMLCFVTFDSDCGPRPDVRVIIDCEKIGDVADITENQYLPSGSTPLYDAMGKSINALRSIVNESDHVLVTVVTDGFENASREYSAMQIKELVESLSSEGWVFTYIGANQDSARTAQGLGISSTMDFEASGLGADLMFRKMASGNREYYKRVRYAKEAGIKMDAYDDFFAEKQAMMRITPERIFDLREGQVLVLGGAPGQAKGLQGDKYYIPTGGVSLDEISFHVGEFIHFADLHPETTFLVTRIGCGGAGYTDELIAPLFAKAYCLPNVYLPASFWKVLSYKYNR